MQIELTQDELETINSALECWEKGASTDALLGEMLTMMVTPKDRADEAKASSIARVEKASQESRGRKLKSLMIRAKLAQCITSLMTTTPS